MDKQTFIQLADKIADGIATEKELSLYKDYINEFKDDAAWNEQLTGSEQATKLQLHEMNSRNAKIKTVPCYNRKAFRYLVTACIALIATAIGAIFYNNHPKPIKDKNKVILKNDVEPGGNKAVLLLANGTRILLGDVDNGKIAEERGISIMETKDGQLIYRINNLALAANGPEPGVIYHTISTPRGGQYQVFLADGTKVWLNASSSLKFPTSFTTTQRSVKLTGEAYFEIAGSKDKPFVVNVDEMKVQAMGTHFNVMAYPDEQYISATLVEGSVKVIKNMESRVLLPGQQARMTEVIQIINATDNAIAWKNGLTSFRDADIRTIMRQVARWYDVEVNYEGDIPNILFTGEISRKANLSELIKLLGLSNIQLKLEGKMITIMP